MGKFNLASQSDLFKKILSLTRPSELPHQIAIQQVVEVLVSLGFNSVRYYDVIYDVAADDHLLVLSASSDGSDKIGYKIQYRNSTLGKSGQKAQPIIDFGGSKVLTKEQRSWVAELGLEKKHWVDLPICAGDELLGLIACDWLIEDGQSLSEEDVVLLELIASRVAANLVSSANRRLPELQNNITTKCAAESQPAILLETAANEIVAALDAAIVAVFEYDWETENLTKIIEVVHPSLRAKHRDFEEIYPVGHSAVTRQAWENEKFRHIVDFDALFARKPECVYQPSHNRHNVLLGNISSIVYNVMGKDCQFMIRVMNRAENPKLPFVNTHRLIFESLCQDISEILERVITRKRLDNLQNVATGIVGKIGNLEEALKLIRKGVAEEGLDNVAILTHSEDSESFTYENYFGLIFNDWRLQTRPSQPWQDNRFYESSVSQDKPFSLDVKRRSETLGRGHFLTYLLQKGVRAAFCCPIKASRIRGIMIFPLRASGHENAVGYRLPKPGEAKQDMLATYAAMVGSCIDATESHLTAEGARMLVGHIGHEVNTPAIILGQEAKRAMLLARQAVPDSDIEFHTELRGARDSIKQALLAMKKTMDLALSVAQGGKESMQMHFQAASLYKVLEDARTSLSGEMMEQSPDGRIREYRIEFGPSCLKLGELVCDEVFLKQVFINLLRNGMKYSLPRYHGLPMTVSVLGMRQTGVSIIQVTNWGIGIPQEDFDKIFKPFVRGSVHDRMKAIRGMGLGLFMAHRIVAAHNGRLYCHHSRCTLDDPERKQRWEGFETTFEIRLPQNLQAGIRDYEWKT